MANPATEDTGLYAGLVLGGKYRLEAEIGRGAMGTVWAAMHETLGQRVAVKVISEEHAGSDELRKRFDTEARAAAKLRSRFVVGVYDNGVTASGLPYIVMEYLEGECLEDRIARQGCISVAETARISRHLARALAKAHVHGIVHRDLKPANIFITKSDDEDDGDDWTAKVLDFGIAKMDDFGDRSTTKTGTVLGTPLFMSPEQVRGASNVDSRADLYSMGMVIYNMLTGTYAFEGQSFGDLLVSICTDPLPDLSRSAPDAPPALDAWFKKACAREPDERYQTADELMRGLTEAIGDTAPGTRLSVSDITASEHMIPLAETFAATSDVAESGSRALSIGASAHTINDSPSRKPPLTLLVGGAAVVIGLIIAFATSGADQGGDDSVGASQPIPAEVPMDAAQADPADVVNLDDKAADDSKSADEQDAADENDEAVGEQTVGDKTVGDKTVDKTVDKAANPAPANPKPVASPTKVRKPQPAPAPAAVSPAPKPNPAPKPKTTGPLAPDLGF